MTIQQIVQNALDEDLGAGGSVDANHPTVEPSGGITPEAARARAEAGAGFVSVGAPKHSSRAFDINGRLELE